MDSVEVDLTCFLLTLHWKSMKNRLVTVFHAPRLKLGEWISAADRSAFSYRRKFPKGGGCWECGAILAGDGQQCAECAQKWDW